MGEMLSSSDRYHLGRTPGDMTLLASDNEQPYIHVREFHRRLAAASLGKERQAFRVPADLDFASIPFVSGKS